MLILLGESTLYVEKLINHFQNLLNLDGLGWLTKAIIRGDLLNNAFWKQGDKLEELYQLEVNQDEIGYNKASTRRILDDNVIVVILFEWVCP